MRLKEKRFISLDFYKKMCRFRNIEFLHWDEKYYSIIFTYNVNFIYDPSKESLKIYWHNDNI